VKWAVAIQNGEVVHVTRQEILDNSEFDVVVILDAESPTDAAEKAQDALRAEE